MNSKKERGGCRGKERTLDAHRDRDYIGQRKTHRDRGGDIRDTDRDRETESEMERLGKRKANKKEERRERDNRRQRGDRHRDRTEDGGIEGQKDTQRLEKEPQGGMWISFSIESTCYSCFPT